MAEALGSSNVSQVVDLQLNTNNEYTVGYGIYENGTPSRILLINFMDDLQAGTATYTGYVHIGGVDGIADTTPTTIDVRYLAAPSVSEKFNITWAGQTMGGQFMSDGRLQGDVVTQTITCIPTTGALHASRTNGCLSCLYENRQSRVQSETQLRSFVAY